MIGIVDYGIGNLYSIKNMLTFIGVQSFIVDSPLTLCTNNLDKLILPGVGSFDAGMNGLLEKNWIEKLNELVLDRKIPILGICLGMQLMCNKSEEGVLQGLGWFDASVVKITAENDGKLKVPHMGWNSVNVVKDNTILQTNDSELSEYYFVHSYHVSCKHYEDVLANTFYGTYLTAAISKNNIYGVQFHPEKSHKYGMSVLKNFASLSK